MCLEWLLHIREKRLGDSGKALIMLKSCSGQLETLVARVKAGNIQKIGD